MRRHRAIAAEAWRNPPYDLVYQAFLLNQQWWHNAMTGVRGVNKRNENMVAFATRQFLDVWSPSNSVFTNPDVLARTQLEGGMNLVRGWQNFREDQERTTSGKKPELYTETLLPKVAEGIAASEDPSKSYDRMIEVKVSFDTDKARALEDTRHWAALALTPEEKMTVEDPVEMQRLADALPLERAASRWIVSSEADEHVERIGYYVGLGFRHLVFHAPGPDQARFLKLYGQHVLPRLRKRFG